MTGLLSDTSLRELGAHIRRFHSLGEVLGFWLSQRQRRQPKGVNVDGQRIPYSREEESIAQATFAAITSCMSEHHREDLEDWPLSEWRIEALAHWERSDAMSRTYMAERLGWSDTVCERFMGETASVLRRRMRKRELIP